MGFPQQLKAQLPKGHFVRLLVATSSHLHTLHV